MTALAGFAERVAARADEFDRAGQVPEEVIAELAGNGWLGAACPVEDGGLGLDPVAFGRLNEALGRASSSLRALVTVHTMVLDAVRRWGSAEQRARYVRPLARGELVGAFALTEAAAGSDALAIEATATPDGDGFRLAGSKSWVTFGRRADVFLVFARLPAGPTAFLVERDRVRVRAIERLPGDRASMPARVELAGCRVPGSAQLGGAGLGCALVAPAALCWGRYSVAWGCVGLAAACLDAAVAHTTGRRQFGAPLADFQLVQEMITDMAVGVEAARLLCVEAGRAADRHGRPPVAQTQLAKYFAARTLTRTAGDALRLHGAAGWDEGSPVHRYFRDAQAMETIEGSTQRLQVAIAERVCRAGRVP